MYAYANMWADWTFDNFLKMIVQEQISYIDKKKIRLYKEVFKFFQKGLYTAWDSLNERERKNFIYWLNYYAEDVSDSDGTKVEVIDVLEMVNKIGGRGKAFDALNYLVYQRDRELWMQDPFKLWLTKAKADQKLIESKIAHLSNV